MLKSIAPVDAPLQRMLVLENVAARAAGSDIRTVAVFEHPKPSETFTVYVFADRFVIVAKV